MTTTLTQKQLTKIHSNIICTTLGIPIGTYSFPIEESGYVKAVVNALFILKDDNMMYDEQVIGNVIKYLSIFYEIIKSEANKGDFIANLYEQMNRLGRCNIPNELNNKKVPTMILKDIYNDRIKWELDCINRSFLHQLHNYSNTCRRDYNSSLTRVLAKLGDVKDFVKQYEENYKLIDKWLEM